MIKARVEEVRRAGSEWDCELGFGLRVEGLEAKKKPRNGSQNPVLKRVRDCFHSVALAPVHVVPPWLARLPISNDPFEVSGTPFMSNFPL